MAVRSRKSRGFLEVHQAALKQLAEAPLPPAIVITGDVPYLKERLIEAAAERAGGQVESFAPRPGERDAAAVHYLEQQSIDRLRVVSFIAHGIAEIGGDRPADLPEEEMLVATRQVIDEAVRLIGEILEDEDLAAAGRERLVTLMRKLREAGGRLDSG